MSAEARFDGGQGKMTTGALRIALAGNPNCGKTTVFNAYTGARQHVGNYPGVTVDRKEGHVRHGNADITLVDLPGTYSLTAYSMEELVARAELGSGDVQAVINVVDASALERNLLLTVQMMEMGLPVVLVCNMMDEARKAGVHIDMERLSAMMGIPVVSAVARTGEGLQQLLLDEVYVGDLLHLLFDVAVVFDIDAALRDHGGHSLSGLGVGFGYGQANISPFHKDAPSVYSGYTAFIVPDSGPGCKLPERKMCEKAFFFSGGMLIWSRTRIRPGRFLPEVPAAVFPKGGIIVCFWEWIFIAGSLPSSLHSSSPSFRSLCR